MTTPNDDLPDLIISVVDKPPRHDPRCDITAQVMRRIATAPQPVYEKDLSWSVVAVGALVLLALVILFDYFYLGDWQQINVLDSALHLSADYTNALDAQGFPYVEALCALLVIPLFYLLLGQSEHFEETR